MVVPRRHQLGRRDVVVVHDQRLGPAGQPRRHGRRGGELVHDDVARLRHVGVGEDGHRLVRGVVVDGVDEDLRAEAAGPGGVAQAQGVPAHGVAAVQDGDEVVDAAHEGAAADRAKRRSCPVPSGSGATSTNPARSSSSSQVASCSGRPSTRSWAAASRALDGRHGLGDHDERAPRAGAPAGSGPAAGAARAAAGGRPRRSARRRRASRPGGTPGTPTPRRWSPSSRARGRAAPPRPRGSTPCASAPRSRSARGGRPRRSRRGRSSPPGVRASTCAATGPTHAPSSRAGTSQAAPVHGPVLGGQPRLERRDPGRQEAEGLDHVAHRLFELGLLAVRRARRRGPGAGAAGRGCPSAGRRRGSAASDVGERRGAGVVRAVAVTQMREGRQEVPGVAALGRQPGEGLAQRLAPPGPGPPAPGLAAPPVLRPASSASPVGGGGCGHGARCYRRCHPALPEARVFRRGDERLPSYAWAKRFGSNVTNARTAGDPMHPRRHRP